MNSRLKDEHARKLHESVADYAEIKQNSGSVVGDDSDYSTEEGGLKEAGVSPVSPRFEVRGLVEAGFKEGGRP